MFLLTARGFFVLAGLGKGKQLGEKPAPVVFAFALFFALSLPAGAILPSRLSLYRGYNGVDGSLEKQFVDLSLKRALIVLPTHEWQGWAAASRLLDLYPDAPILVIQAEPDDSTIATIAAGRPILFWRDGQLAPRP